MTAARCPLVVVHDAWRPDLLAWIHRREAFSLAAELRDRGHDVRLAHYDGPPVHVPGAGRHLLRLSDPVMFRAAEAYASARAPYAGPGHAAMTRCYDKLAACRLVAASGSPVPETAPADDVDVVAFDAVVKPRRGSDSIGLRRVARGRAPPRRRAAPAIVQRRIAGSEITIAVLDGKPGVPLRIDLPADASYTFVRKYLLRPRIVPMRSGELADRVRDDAVRIAALLGVDWAARVDFIHEHASDALYFLECDVAPLVGAASAFATSLKEAGTARAAQLDALLRDRS